MMVDLAATCQCERCAPRRTRTSDRRIRNPLLYPAELWALERRDDNHAHRLCRDDDVRRIGGSPALFKYFPETPREIYVRPEPKP